MNKYDFTLDQIDKDLLERLVIDTTNSIYYSAKARKGRDYETIYNSVYNGLAAEAYLIQYHDCTPNNTRYGDVVTKSGILIECKTSSIPWSIDRVKETLESIKHYNPSEYVMFWYREGKNYQHIISKKR